MYHHSSNDDGHEPLCFGSFLPNVSEESGLRILKSKPVRRLSRISQRIMPSSLHERLRYFVRTVLGRRVVSRSSLDIYGRPRILTGWEAVLHSLAWPTLIGFVVGFALAISLTAIRNAELLHQQQEHNSQQMAALEIVP
jgi:hypothetical protein